MDTLLQLYSFLVVLNLKLHVAHLYMSVFQDLRRHPRAVLRHEGAIQSWRRLPQDQLSLPRGFRRSWLLLRRNFFAPPCPQSNQPLFISLSLSLPFLFLIFSSRNMHRFRFTRSLSGCHINYKLIMSMWLSLFFE